MFGQFIWWFFQNVTVDAPATSGLRVIRWFCYLKYGKKTKEYDEEILAYAKNPDGKTLMEAVSPGALAKKKMDDSINKKSLCVRAAYRAMEIKDETDKLNAKIDNALKNGKTAAAVAKIIGQTIQDLEVDNASLEYDNAITKCCKKAPKMTEKMQAVKDKAKDEAAALAASMAGACADVLCDFLTTLTIGVPCAFVISCIDEGMVAMCLSAVMFEAMCFSWLMIDIFPFNPQTGVPLFMTVPPCDAQGVYIGKPVVHWKKIIVCCQRNFDSEGKRLPRPTGNGWVAYLDPKKACCAAAPLTRAILVFVGLFVLFMLPPLEGSTAMWCTGPFFDRVRKVLNGPKYMGIMTSESMPKGYWMAHARSYAKEQSGGLIDLSEDFNEDKLKDIQRMVSGATEMKNWNGEVSAASVEVTIQA